MSNLFELELERQEEYHQLKEKEQNLDAKIKKLDAEMVTTRAEIFDALRDRVTFLEHQNSQLREQLVAERQAAFEQAASALDAPPSGTLIQDVEWAKQSEEEEEDELLPLGLDNKKNVELPPLLPPLLPQLDLDEYQIFPNFYL